MFGQPQWFDLGKDRFWLRPRRWQGWMYLAVGCLVLVGPFALLLARDQIIESLIWALAASGMAALELRPLRRAHRECLEYDQWFRIEDRSDDTPVQSERYIVIPPKR